MPGELLHEFLDEAGVSYESHAHTRAFTAQELADAEHVTGYAVAKPVLLKADERLVMMVVPAAFSLDLDKAKEVLGTDNVRMAKESEFDPAFPDCQVGAEPPFGSLYDIPTFVDERLGSERISFAAGSHEESITMTRDDYLALAHPQMADLALQGSPA